MLARLVPGYVKRKQQAAETQSVRQRQDWLHQIELTRASNEAAEKDFVSQRATWEEGRAKHETQAGCDSAHVASAKTHADYDAGHSSAVLSFCEMILSRSSHQLFSPADCEIDYAAETKSLIVEYSLPAPEKLPDVREVRYIKVRDELVLLRCNETEQARFYDSVLYQAIVMLLGSSCCLFILETYMSFSEQILLTRYKQLRSMAG